MRERECVSLGEGGWGVSLVVGCSCVGHGGPRVVGHRCYQGGLPLIFRHWGLGKEASAAGGEPVSVR
jgi:hypothetical protein